MVEKPVGIIVQDRESVVSRRSLLGSNGNGTSTRQLPPVILEPKLDEPEADGGNTAHEDDALEVKEASTPARSRSKRHILFAIMGIVLVGAVVGVRYWLHSRQYESTDDAFIEGHAAQVSPKVSGYAQKIYITDNQQVKA